MRTKKDFDKQNDYNKIKYDHINLMLPKGKKDIITEFAKMNDMSNNAFIQEAIELRMNTPKVIGLKGFLKRKTRANKYYKITFIKK